MGNFWYTWEEATRRWKGSGAGLTGHPGGSHSGVMLEGAGETASIDLLCIKDDGVNITVHTIVHIFAKLLLSHAF